MNSNNASFSDTTSFSPVPRVAVLGGGVDCNVKMSTPVVTLSAALSPAMSHLSKLLDSLCRAFIRVPVEGGSNWAVETTYSNNACLLNRPVY